MTTPAAPCLPPALVFSDVLLLFIGVWAEDVSPEEFSLDSRTLPTATRLLRSEDFPRLPFTATAASSGLVGLMPGWPPCPLSCPSDNSRCSRGSCSWYRLCSLNSFSLLSSSSRLLSTSLSSSCSLSLSPHDCSFPPPLGSSRALMVLALFFPLSSESIIRRCFFPPWSLPYLSFVTVFHFSMLQRRIGRRREDAFLPLRFSSPSAKGRHTMWPFIPPFSISWWALATS
mmetsp:Transcript_59745/g.177043  ORF Transcript_59745/g.177043 Transcript_59745/m.177043 type:complete len:229 (-) Transcript_59745:1644-2330(-)